jgi:hypothetical protein
MAYQEYSSFYIRLRHDKRVGEVLSVLSLQGDDFAADIRIDVEGFPEMVD